MASDAYVKALSEVWQEDSKAWLGQPKVRLKATAWLNILEA